MSGRQTFRVHRIHTLPDGSVILETDAGFVAIKRGAVGDGSRAVRFPIGFEEWADLQDEDGRHWLDCSEIAALDHLDGSIVF